MFSVKVPQLVLRYGLFRVGHIIYIILLHTSLLTQAQDSKQEEYKEKARQMLSEAFGTPKTERRMDTQKERTTEEVNAVERPSPVSSSPVKAADEEEPPSVAPIKPNSDSSRRKTPVKVTQSLGLEPVKSGESTGHDERRRGSAGSIERRRLPDTAVKGPQVETPRQSSLGQSNASSRQRKQRPTRTLPTAKPVTSTPSSRVKRLTELNKQRSAEADGPSEGKPGDETSNGLEQKPIENGESKSGDPPRRIVITPLEDVSARWGSPKHDKTLEVSSLFDLWLLLQMAVN